MAEINSTATHEEKMPGLPPDLLEHFYDLRALAVNAKAVLFDFEDCGEGINAAIRVLSILENMASQFANEADEFLLHLHAARAQNTKEA